MRTLGHERPVVIAVRRLGALHPNQGVVPVQVEGGGAAVGGTIMLDVFIANAYRRDFHSCSMAPSTCAISPCKVPAALVCKLVWPQSGHALK